MIKVGSFYYWFGENRDGTNLVSAYRSTDLKNWTFRAHVLRKNMGGELATANIERPKVLFNALTGTYVLWAHKENGVDYGEARVAVASASNVEGPVHVPRQLPAARIRFPRHDGLQRQRHRLPDLGHAGERRSQHLPPHARTSWTSSRWCARSGPGSTAKRRPCSRRGSTYFLVTSGATGWNPNQAKYATASSIERDVERRWRTSPMPRPTARSPPTSYRCRDPRRRPICIWATAGPAPGADRSTIPSTCGCL